jgi:hypothetical protein
VERRVVLAEDGEIAALAEVGGLSAGCGRGEENEDGELGNHERARLDTASGTSAGMSAGAAGKSARATYFGLRTYINW